MCVCVCVCVCRYLRVHVRVLLHALLWHAFCAFLDLLFREYAGVTVVLLALTLCLVCLSQTIGSLNTLADGLVTFNTEISNLQSL